ncbi:MAG: spermine synthase [Opitutus sp.]
MKPQLKLGEARTPDGGNLALFSHDGRFSVRLNGQELMHSAVATSEIQLGELAVENVTSRTAARILIGGLGLAFTLKAVLERVGPTAAIVVVELISEVVEWNRTHLAGLNGSTLGDKRVTIAVDDVSAVLVRTPPASFDVIILDVDNGPTAMVHRPNARLYDAGGIKRLATALRVAGRLAVWSASPDTAFERRLVQAGLRVQTVPAKVHAGARRASYILYLADKVG